MPPTTRSKPSLEAAKDWFGFVPNLRRWFETVRARPATVRAYAKGEPYANRPAVTEEGKKTRFGQTAAGPKTA